MALEKLFSERCIGSFTSLSMAFWGGKKLHTGGPWWFIQLRAHIYFQSHLPHLPPLADCVFPDRHDQQIFCTSYGQALYSRPGCKLNPKGVAVGSRSSSKACPILSFFLTSMIPPSRTQLRSTSTNWPTTSRSANVLHHDLPRVLAYWHEHFQPD